MFLHKNTLIIQFQSHRKLFQRVIYQVPYLHLTQLLLYPATVWSPKEGMAFCIQFQYSTWTFWTLLELYYVHKLAFGVMSSDVPGHVYKSALKETKINRLLSQTWSTLCFPFNAKISCLIWCHWCCTHYGVVWIWLVRCALSTMCSS